MRKFIKKQLKELLATINEGIAYAVSENENKELKKNILIDCYSAFSHIKEVLSKDLNCERFSDYDECITEIQKDMEILNDSIQSKTDCKEISGILNVNLNVFSEMLENEKIKIEAVFLPYKASMWDSLESVWKAAEKDESCDAYVIAIPYYDRNPDFTIGKEHYEGELFPDYVPIMHYNDYNFKARKPDIIFIHNAYDDCNYITTVHPFFYSKNLNKFTDKLVYIPYFVLNEVDPNDKDAIESISHFCDEPGVINADAVIVQSEDMRKIYINVLDEFGKKSGIKREYWERKILGLGSPKFDIVLSTRKEDLNIPDEWLKIIEKSDGSRKKIILYNTSVVALLKNNEKMLEKIKSVLRTFKENKDNVALLWRPHPLMNATLISMRPSLWEDYKKITDEYISEGWGIYDDTPDNNRAIILSDAYYGDGSSLVQMYQQTEKPVLIQNADVKVKLTEEEKRTIYFEDIAVDGEKGYFSAINFNGLFEMNMNTKETRLLGHFPLSPLNGKRLYSTILKHNNRLYLAPMDSKYFAVYDFESKVIKEFELNNLISEKETDDCKYCKFYSMAAYENNIFMIGCSFPAIVRFNTETEEMTCHTQDIFKEIEFKRIDNDFFFGKDNVVLDNMLYLGCITLNCVLEFDMKTFTSKLYHIKESKEGYTGICYDGNNFYLAERKSGNVIKWNKENNKIKLFEINAKHREFEPKWSYINIFCDDNNLWLFPATTEDVVKIDTVTGKTDIFDVFDKKVYKENTLYNPKVWFSKYMFAKKVNDKIFAFPAKTGELITQDTNTCKVYSEIIKLPLNMDLKNLEIKGQISEIKEKFFCECLYLELSEFINTINEKSSNEKYKDKLYFQCGKKIYKYLKNIFIVSLL